MIPGQSWLFFREFEASAVIRGDGETTLVQVFGRLSRNEEITEIPGVQTSENQEIEPYFVKNLDNLPRPAWELFNMDQYRPSVRRDLFADPCFPVIGSRGCSFGCSFCISGQYIKYRRRSFESIAEELKSLRDCFGVRSVIFYDDALFPNASRVNEEIHVLSDLINEASPGILWQIEMRPDVFANISGETFKHIFARGCCQLNIGVETSSHDQLEILAKPYSTESLRESCNLVSQVCKNLRLTGTFILGGPKESIGSIRETVDFSTELNLLFAHYSPLELYPGTPIYEMVFGQDKETWYHKIMDDKWQWGEIIYEDEDISAELLIKLVSSAYHRFYNRREWKGIAKRCLGNNYRRVSRIVKSWERDRLRL